MSKGRVIFWRSLTESNRWCWSVENGQGRIVARYIVARDTLSQAVKDCKAAARVLSNADNIIMARKAARLKAE